MIGEQYNVMALCAGVGGLEFGIALALNHLGASSRGIVYVEREAAAAASLVASMEAGWLHPAPVWSDMLTFDARPWRGVVHILASGDPCQDNSVAGKRAGADGERFLAAEVTRLAEECRPRLIVRENVPGNAHEQLAAIAPPLERLGYRVAAGIFSSSRTGNTMQRERLFIMAVCESGGLGEFGPQDRSGCFGHADSGSARLGGAASGADGREVGGVSHERHERGRVARRRGNGPSNADSALGGADGERLQTRVGQQPVKSSPRRASAKRASSELGRTAGTRSLPGAQSGVHRGEEGSGPRHAEPQRRGGELAGSDGTRSKVGIPASSGRFGRDSGVAIDGGRRLPPAVIPGPSDTARWIDVLDRFPELQPALSEEEAQSHLRRGIDALAHRTERLRATGNGVDPMVAAYAVLSLGALLGLWADQPAGELVLT